MKNCLLQIHLIAFDKSKFDVYNILKHCRSTQCLISASFLTCNIQFILIIALCIG